jgi:hypothetical protein
MVNATARFDLRQAVRPKHRDERAKGPRPARGYGVLRRAATSVSADLQLAGSSWTRK